FNLYEKVVQMSKPPKLRVPLQSIGDPAFVRPGHSYSKKELWPLRPSRREPTHEQQVRQFDPEGSLVSILVACSKHLTLLLTKSYRGLETP
ncbi:MAG: hypothetical protein AAF438_19635, partial [Pseudomonadota bacterium]